MTVCCKNAAMGYDCQCNSGADMTSHDDMSPEVFGRIEALEAENARLRDLAGPLFDAAHQVHRDGGRALARLVTDFCAALEEKTDDG